MKEISNVSRQTFSTPPTNNTYYRDTELAKKFGVSRVTIWRWVKEGNLPSPVKFSKGCTRWSGRSVDAWEAEQAAE